MINTKKVKGRLVEKGYTQKELALKMGLSQAAVNQKLNNIRPMNLEEAEKLSHILDIDSKEFGNYFFYEKSCTVLHDISEEELNNEEGA